LAEEGWTTTEGTTKTDGYGQTDRGTDDNGRDDGTDGRTGGRRRRLDTTGQRDGRRKDYRKLGSLSPLNLIVETPGSIFKSADAETTAQLEIAGTDPSVMACLVVALIH
jgi:hypothetical protein